MTLFVYGELCKPAVLLAVIGRVPRAEPAVIVGFQRRLNAQTGYFQAVPRPGAVTAGLLLNDLEAREMTALDSFENVEGGEYARIEAEARELAAGAGRVVWVYATSDDARRSS